ncbi:MAG: hypothetical protein BMS9Abin32_547 [Gammaproteobacteria bacterium]|nr:MAG: hypothetical protein BMS9Abin32_547 [Gammaproteobacteria bacterium]
MNFRLSQAALLVSALLLGNTASADSNFWLGGKIGTLGIGLEATWRPVRWFDFRVGGNRFDYKETGSQAGVNYDATLKLNTYYATMNFRFPLSPFRITVGGYSNQNSIEMVSINGTSFDIGGTTFSAADVGTLRSETTFDSTSPYLGAGFDFTMFGKLGLNMDFGVLWQGDPKVSLTGDGLLASDPAFLAQLEIERSQLMNEVDALKAYPVVSIGINFNF